MDLADRNMQYKYHITYIYDLLSFLFLCSYWNKYCKLILVGRFVFGPVFLEVLQFAPRIIIKL